MEEGFEEFIQFAIYRVTYRVNGEREYTVNLQPYTMKDRASSVFEALINIAEYCLFLQLMYTHL